MRKIFLKLSLIVSVIFLGLNLAVASSNQVQFSLKVNSILLKNKHDSFSKNNEVYFKFFDSWRSAKRIPYAGHYQVKANKKYVPDAQNFDNHFSLYETQEVKVEIWEANGFLEGNDKLITSFPVNFSKLSGLVLNKVDFFEDNEVEIQYEISTVSHSFPLCAIKQLVINGSEVSFNPVSNEGENQRSFLYSSERGTVEIVVDFLPQFLQFPRTLLGDYFVNPDISFINVDIENRNLEYRSDIADSIHPYRLLPKPPWAYDSVKNQYQAHVSFISSSYAYTYETMVDDVAMGEIRDGISSIPQKISEVFKTHLGLKLPSNILEAMVVINGSDDGNLSKESAKVRLKVAKTLYEEVLLHLEHKGFCKQHFALISDFVSSRLSLLEKASESLNEAKSNEEVETIIQGLINQMETSRFPKDVGPHSKDS